MAKYLLTALHAGTEKSVVDVRLISQLISQVISQLIHQLVRRLYIGHHSCALCCAVYTVVRSAASQVRHQTQTPGLKR